MLNNKLEQISLLLVVLVEEAAAAAVVVEAAVAAPAVAVLVEEEAVVVEYHHTPIHVPIEPQAVVKVSDDIYSHNAPLLCCSLYQCTCCMLDISISIYPCLVFLLHNPSNEK
jgi:hypothetical protein